MLRLNIQSDTALYSYTIAVRAYSMNDILTDSAFSEKLRSLKAMLSGIKLKVYIMKKSYYAPIFGVARLLVQPGPACPWI